MCFIRHRDEVIDKTVLPSGWEQMSAIHADLSEIKAGPDMFHKPVVFAMRCLDCERVRIVRR